MRLFYFCSDTLRFRVLELSALGFDVGLGARSRETSSSTEMLLGLSIVVSSQEMNSFTFGSDHNQLIKSHALATSFDNSSASRFSESESSDSHLGDLKLTLIISDGSNKYNSLTLVSLLITMLNEL